VTRNTSSAVENNGAIGKGRRSEQDLSSYAPKDFESNEFFGGGSEYLPFWRPPFRWIRLFEEEDE
jgi:hypothetical protein